MSTLGFGSEDNSLTDWIHSWRLAQLQPTEDFPKPSFWWLLRTPKQKNVFIAITVLIVLCLLLLLFYPAFSVKMQICDSPTCLRTAAELRRRTDPSVDPCDDFYRFSCRHVLEDVESGNEDSRTSADFTDDDGIQSQIRQLLQEPIILEDSKALNVAKRFYRACLDENAIQAQGLSRIKRIFREIGGWPTLEGDDWQEEEFDWVRSIGKLARMGVNFDVFFKVTVDRNKGDDARHVLGIHDVQYTPTEISKELKSLYLDYMVDIAVLFGANKYTAREDSQDVLNVFLDLAKMTKSSAETNQTNLYDKLTISELTYHYPTIPWYDYITGLLNPYDVMLTYYHEIVVADPVYLRQLESFLRDTSRRKMANFIVWHTLQYLINYLPLQVLDRAHEFLQRINGGTLKTPRWQTCLKATEDRMSSVIAATFIQRFFHDDVRFKILRMVNNLKHQFKTSLLALEWFDRPTKELILEKLLTSVEEIVSYSDMLSILNENKLMFDQVEVRNKTFLDFVLDLDRINMNKEFSKLKRPYEDNFLRDSKFLLGTNIHYSKKKNSLVFPIGIFRGIFYDVDRPDYMNYAILGSLIAHEISHIFMEAQYGHLRGELRTMWSPFSLLKYDEKLKCLAEQYMSDRGNETQYNFRLTRDEDIADLAGMKISYDTYTGMVRENGAESLLPGLEYSPNQLFWISASSRHCPSLLQTSDVEREASRRTSPSRLRVNGPLRNLQEFAFDFGCKKGSSMNPITKCRVW